jgi:hypothetical protein
VLVTPEARGNCCAGYVAGRGKEFAEAVVGQLAGLQEAVHAFANLGIYVAVIDFRFEVIEGDDLGRQHEGRDADVFVHFKVATQEEILEVDRHEFGLGRAEGAVEEQFGGNDVGGFCGDAAMLFNFVSAGGPTDATGVRFFGAISADDAYVGGAFVLGDLIAVNKEEGVGACRHVGVGPKALEHPSNFFFIGGVPVVALTALTEFSVFGDGARIGVNGGAM